MMTRFQDHMIRGSYASNSKLRVTDLLTRLKSRDARASKKHSSSCPFIVVTKVKNSSETYLKDDKHRPVSCGGQSSHEIQKSASSVDAASNTLHFSSKWQ